MTKQRKYDWPKLIEALNQSGLIQTQFCEENNLNPKYFSLKRSKLLSSDRPAFEKAVIETPPESPVSLTIQVGRCKIHCPDAMPVQSFAALEHSLL